MSDAPYEAPYSADVARKSGSNFYWSFFFLPKVKKNAIFAVYAFSRLVDDAVDEAADEAKARGEIALWRRRLAACYGEGSIDDAALSHPLLPELKQTVALFSIPRAYFDDLITGMEMDLAKKRYASFDELETYCYHVASTIGLLCNHLFGYRDEEAAHRYAVLLGKAFQLTNIIRDVGKDAKLGRIYLPKEDLDRFGVLENDVLEGRASENFRRLMGFEAERASDYFARAFAALPQAKRKKIVPAEMMAAFYQSLLKKTCEQNFPVFERKVSLSGLEKAALAAKTLVGAI
ncbi:MAG TPA: presqualene diphosphate synthase HpnD [bacterium]|nr:presqualene diphosphate synthase HpnD [bacterium]